MQVLLVGMSSPEGCVAQRLTSAQLDLDKGRKASSPLITRSDLDGSTAHGHEAGWWHCWAGE
jgi:hypothetical protein